MSTFRFKWRGFDRLGQRVQGELTAKSKEEVSAQLFKQRIRATQIQRQYDLLTRWSWRAQPRIKHTDITRLTRQLATLLHAGVALLQAMDILEKGESHAGLKTLLRQLHHRIEDGLALNQALRERTEFSALYCNLVMVGEVTGQLDVTLDGLALYLEKAQALRAALRSALIYPIAVVTVACVVMGVILVLVVPAFQSIFASFGAQLPWPTRCVIAMSEWVVQDGVYALMLMLVVGGWAMRQYRQKPHWQIKLQHLLLQLPIAGSLLRHASTARWTRTLATLFAAGVPLTEALDCVKGVTGNILFESATASIVQQLLQGISLSQALQSTQGLFPTMVIQMCAIGEESGALEHMLDKTAQHYEQDVDHTVARLSTLLEPFIMVVLGVSIGGLVMALYLPIFQLGQAV